MDLRLSLQSEVADDSTRLHTERSQRGPSSRPSIQWLRQAAPNVPPDQSPKSVSPAVPPTYEGLNVDVSTTTEATCALILMQMIPA